MSVAQAILKTPPQPFFPKFNPISYSSFPFPPTSKFVFSGKFVSRNSLIWVNGGRSCMAAELSVGGSGGTAGFEQEAFIDASSGLTPNYTAGGLETILNRLSKWFVAATFGGVILLRHDAKALWAAMGSVLNVLLSITLKQILNQERPVSALSSGPGMPSSHAQSIFFAVVFVILSLVEWLGLNGLATVLSGIVLALGLYFSWLRVSQCYHTMSQVVVGARVGSIFSVLWFWTWDAIVINAYNSYLWVRIVLVLGAASFSLGFIIHVIRCWIKDEN